MKPVIIIAITVFLLIPISAYALEVNLETIDLSKTNPAELVISGEISE